MAVGLGYEGIEDYRAELAKIDELNKNQSYKENKENIISYTYAINLNDTKLQFERFQNVINKKL